MTGELLEGMNCVLNIRGCVTGTCCNDAILKSDVDEEGNMPSDYGDRMMSICAREEEVEWTNPANEEPYWLTPLDICTDGASKLATSLIALATVTYAMA